MIIINIGSAAVGRQQAELAAGQTSTSTSSLTPAEVTNSQGDRLNYFRTVSVQEVRAIKQERAGGGREEGRTEGGGVSANGWKCERWPTGRRARSQRRAGRTVPGSQSSSLLSTGRAGVPY